jgi:hypothetical protein
VTWSVSCPTLLPSQDQVTLSYSTKKKKNNSQYSYWAMNARPRTCGSILGRHWLSLLMVTSNSCHRAIMPKAWGRSLNCIRCQKLIKLYLYPTATHTSLTLTTLSFLGALAKLRKATINFVVSVRLFVCLSAWNKSAPTGRILMKFDMRDFFENLPRISASNKGCRRNQSVDFLFSVTFFSKIVPFTR